MESDSGYSTAEVGRMLGLSPGRVRGFVRGGLLAPRRNPRGDFRFSFQDLVILRAAQGLLAAGLPAQRVRDALARLRGQLPRGRSLAAVRISAEGGQVVARHGAAVWEPRSGQQQIPFAEVAGFEGFAVADLAARAAPLGRRALAAAERRGDLGAEEWYELGYELEATAPAEAEAAYRRALEADPGHAEAQLNLGRLLHSAGDAAAAERCYRRACALRPGEPVAEYNLGVALQDLGRAEEAIAAYRRAIAADPACADAYFNLAGLYDRLGDGPRAFQSLKAYRDLTHR